jgi:hypothetical protein
MIFALINAAIIIYLVLPATKRAFRGEDSDKPIRMAA